MDSYARLSEVSIDIKEDELECIEDKLLFVKGALCLLKDTGLFGPLIEKAISDADFVLRAVQG